MHFDALRAGFARALLHALAFLPRRLAQWFGRCIGRMHFWMNTRARETTEENLALCLPEITGVERRRMVQASLENTGMTLMETPSVWLASSSRLDSWVAGVNGESLLASAELSGKGVLVLLPHLGNWELFNVYYAGRGGMTALYQPPRDRALAILMTSIRSRFGNELVATNKRGLKRLFEVLNQGGVVTVLPDQVPSSGRFVPFFGVEALTDRLTVRLLRQTGACVLLASVTRNPDGRFDLSFSELPDEVYGDNEAAALDVVNRSIEAEVRKYPEQYQWEYKRFRERPVGEVKLYRSGKPPVMH